MLLRDYTAPDEIVEIVGLPSPKVASWPRPASGGGDVLTTELPPPGQVEEIYWAIKSVRFRIN